MKILQAVYVAIINNGKNAEKILGDELIEKLGYLSLERQYDNAQSFDTVKEHFEVAMKVLNFKQRIY